MLVVSESSSLAASAASSSRRRAKPSRGVACSRTKQSSSHVATAASQSLPPSRGSPDEAITSTSPEPTSRMETSKVPPPRSKTITRVSSFWSSANVSAAASGSRNSRTRSRPARRRGLRGEALRIVKVGGTVTTAEVERRPNCLGLCEELAHELRRHRDRRDRTPECRTREGTHECSR